MKFIYKELEEFRKLKGIKELRWNFSEFKMELKQIWNTDME